jgi:hypothetical protein
MRLPSRSQLARFSLDVATLCFCLFALLSVGACHGVSDPAIVQLGEARNLAIDLGTRFATGVAASDRAVMADTDEASVAFAQDAARATEAGEEDRIALASHLVSLHYQEERRLLDEFTESFVEYRKLDKMVLDLAVENTNLKAQRLSFGPVRDAADAFRDALAVVARGAPVKDRCRAEAVASRAILAVRDIQVLQAPHIAESKDAVMDQLEKQMAALDDSAHSALKELSGLIDVGSSLADADTKLSRFERLSHELIALSRRNTNVRSLDLALNQKPAVTGICERKLVALNDALAKRGSKATR